MKDFHWGSLSLLNNADGGGSGSGDIAIFTVPSQGAKGFTPREGALSFPPGSVSGSYQSKVLRGVQVRGVAETSRASQG